MSETRTVKVTISLFGQTREIETKGNLSRNPEREGTIWRAPVPGFVAQIGRGVARYPVTLVLDRLYPGDRPRPGTTKLTDQLGRVFTYHLQTCVRNRQARI